MNGFFAQVDQLPLDLTGTQVGICVPLFADPEARDIR